MCSIELIVGIALAMKMILVEFCDLIDRNQLVLSISTWIELIAVCEKTS